MIQAHKSFAKYDGVLHRQSVRALGRAVCKTSQAEPGIASKPSWRYEVSEAQKQAFKRDGFVYLPGVMSDAEMAKEVDPVYNKFLKDDSALVDVMLPRQQEPSWQGNLLERKAEDIACQLLDTDEVELDFDQILAKRPNSRDSRMPWHQDAAYWPEEMAGYDCYTANCWVAVSDVPMESGCMRYVPGSHLERSLRPHLAVNAEDSEAHALATAVRGEQMRLVPMKRGDVVVHRENVVHGSGPNVTDKWRCAYVLNFKRSSCVVGERALGYTYPQHETDQVPFTP